MEELLRYFDWVALVLACVLTSLTLIVANQTFIGAKVHNAVISLTASTVFSVFLIQWENLAERWQVIGIQFFITTLFATYIGFTKRQDVVDAFTEKILSKVKPKE
jgi:hypothetical protein